MLPNNFVNIFRVIWDRNNILTLLVFHVFSLILIRTIIDADDFNNWDLIPFLNANTADSLWDLLQRPEVHFLRPFSFPLYNVGAESVFSAVLFRFFGHISLYWSNVLVLLIYDIIFLFLVYKVLSLLFPDRLMQYLSWVLISMSPVLLTNASTSAFNMQGYCVILLGLCGTEYMLRKRLLLGGGLLAMAFLFISQGYPLAFFLPYYIGAWLIWRITYHSVSNTDLRDGIYSGSIVLPAIMCGIYVSLMVIFVQHASKGIYLGKISPLNPHDSGNLFSSIGEILFRFVFFLKQSFIPEIKVDNVPVGFGPYFIYLTVLVSSILIVTGYLREKKLGLWIALPYYNRIKIWMYSLASFGLVMFGYLPAFLNPIVKSQRTVLGDIFLVIIIIAIISRLDIRELIKKRIVILLLSLLVLASDSYYMYFVMSVDHSDNHSPVFDFDLSDGRVRHDLVAAIKTMKAQATEERALLVIDYPRGYSENTTDPGMFFAHFLRHYGRFETSKELVFPCKWCDNRYGCPFPGLDRDCANKCCYKSPEIIIKSALGADKKVIVWEKNDSENKTAFVLLGFNRKTIDLTAEGNMPAQIRDWDCFELLPEGIL